MKKNKVLNIVTTLLVLIILIGGSYAFFAYSKKGATNSKVVSGNIYMYYNDTNELSINNVFPQTKEEGILNDYFEFEVSGKNTANNKDIYYAINLVYGNEVPTRKRFHDEDVVFYLTEVVDGEEIVLIDSVQYKSFNDAKIYVETIPNNTKDEIKHVYRLRAWIDEDVLISDSSEDANYTTGEYKNSYASIKINVSGNLKENDINMVLDANDDNYVNGKRAIYADIYGYKDDNLVLEVTSDNENIEFLYVDEYENSIEEAVSKLELNYKTNKKDVITTRVIPISKNDANTKANIYFKLTRNGEVVEQQVKSATIYGNNFCLNNGFDKLYDCILASEAMSSSVESAKTFIANKGEPNLNDTAPSYTYVEDITYDAENVFSSSGYKFHFSDSYEFDSANGTFNLINSNGNDIITDNLSDAYKNYYTCGGTNYGYTSCKFIYLIAETSNDGEIYTITKGNVITYKIATSMRSEVGLYKTEDDYGDAYVYRGDVNNNNVLFGGYYWKVIRTNGDNSIRLIYNGTTSNANGNATSINNTTYTYSNIYPENNSPIIARYAEPTYIGYMYGKNFELQTSEITDYVNFQQLSKYYWADGYDFDEVNEVFRLKKVNLDLVSGTLTEMKDKYESYPYTCVSTNANDACEVVLKVISWVNEKHAKVQYISYSSIDKDSTRTNELSSNAKVQIEKWYETNVIGKTDEFGNLFTDYIIDGTFCNDRSIASGSGFLLTPTTYYGGFNRLTSSDKIANLKCNGDIKDKFSSTSSRGNGLLKHPIALITADEVALAGGKNETKNENYYLNTNVNFWTMTPSRFDSAINRAMVAMVEWSGAMLFSQRVAVAFAVRPVINLSNDVLITQGDGTIDNPFQLTL